MATVELGETLRVGEAVRIRRMRSDHLHIGQAPPPLGSGTDELGDVGEKEGLHLLRWRGRAGP
eukprot:129619-Pyramimonas_sp.AAC.1